MKPDLDERGRWKYGDAGDEFPIEDGAVWTCGPHLVAAGDLERGDGLELLNLAGGAVDLVYVDPPWNAGNARSFRTKAGVGRSVVWDAFLDTLLQVVKHNRLGAWIEMSDTEPAIDGLSRAVARAGGLVYRVEHVRYYRRHRSAVVYAAWGEPDQRMMDVQVAGLDDDDIPLAVLQTVPAGITVMDPCTGLGCTGRAAEQRGCRFVGLELNPRRLANLVRFFARAGHRPQRSCSLTPRSG